MYNIKKDDNTLQDIKRIKDNIKKDNFVPYYLIYGEEGYLINDLKKTIIDHFDKMSNINISVFNEDNYDEIKIKEKLSQFGFLTEKKIIIFENLNLFDIKSKHSTFIDLIDYINDDNIIIFIEYNKDKVDNKKNKSAIDKRCKLYKVLTEKDNFEIIECNNLSFNNLTKYINDRLYNVKKKFDKEDNLRYFIELVGNDLYNIKNEIDKLIYYTEDRYLITKEDIDNITSSVSEEKIYQMIDMINEKDFANALKLYSTLVYNNTAIELIIGIMKKNYLNMYKVKAMIAEGKSFKDIANNLSIEDWRVNKIVSSVRNFSDEYILKKINLLIDIDKKLKTGRLNRDIVFNLFIE